MCGYRRFRVDRVPCHAGEQPRFGDCTLEARCRHVLRIRYMEQQDAHQAWTLCLEIEGRHPGVEYAPGLIPHKLGRAPLKRHPSVQLAPEKVCHIPLRQRSPSSRNRTGPPRGASDFKNPTEFRTGFEAGRVGLSEFDVPGSTMVKLHPRFGSFRRQFVVWCVRTALSCHRISRIHRRRKRKNRGRTSAAGLGCPTTPRQETRVLTWIHS